MASTKGIKSAYRILSINLTERDNLKDQEVGGRTILKRILQKYYKGVNSIHLAPVELQ
jgi:hypothetical protein